MSTSIWGGKSKGVKYVHWVMHKCTMVKVGGKRNTHKVCKKQVNFSKTGGGIFQSRGERINACEMWIWRKMQKISWTEKKTTESVRMEIGIEEDETLQQTALRRKLGFFGHVMRSD